MSMTPHSKISACIICDARWGSGSEVLIEICPKCFRKYHQKVENEGKFLKVECRAEREAVYIAYKRMRDRSDYRIGRRLNVF